MVDSRVNGEGERNGAGTERNGLEVVEVPWLLQAHKSTFVSSVHASRVKVLLPRPRTHA